jgi:hypothetical protein
MSMSENSEGATPTEDADTRRAGFLLIGIVAVVIGVNLPRQTPGAMLIPIAGVGIAFAAIVWG